MHTLHKRHKYLEIQNIQYEQQLKMWYFVLSQRLFSLCKMDPLYNFGSHFSPVTVVYSQDHLYQNV